MRVLLSTLAIALLSGCGMAGREAGPSGTRDFPATGFDAVTLAGPDDVTVAIGPARVSAEGGQNVLDTLDVTVRDGRLVVGRRRGVEPVRGKATVRVTMPAIRDASLSGAGRLTVEGTGPGIARFNGDVSGAGSLKVSDLKAETVALNLSGAGGMTVAGTAREATMKVGGAGGIDADGLTVTNLTVGLSGVGDITARATGRATGSVSGVGGVTVRGTTDCAVSKSGVGSVKCGG